jgi:hypothetical protein
VPLRRGPLLAGAWSGFGRYAGARRTLREHVLVTAFPATSLQVLLDRCDRGLSDGEAPVSVGLLSPDICEAAAHDLTRIRCRIAWLYDLFTHDHHVVPTDKASIVSSADS